MLNHYAHRKRKVKSHISEDKSIEIIKSKLPSYWTSRLFNNPDYGIDLVLEIFMETEESSQIYETLGEYLFVQAKSVESAKFEMVRYHPVMNVTKYSYSEDRSIGIDAQVIKYSIDTDELVTIQGMGASVCVLLLLVVLESKRVFFLNLNDLVDKILIPKKPGFFTQKSVLIEIPIANEITDNPSSIEPLRFYAKRSKMLSAFSVFLYQQNELNYSLQAFNPSFWGPRSIDAMQFKPDDKEVDVMLKNFIQQIIGLDIWQLKDFDYFTEEVKNDVWSFLTIYHKKIMVLSEKLNVEQFNSKKDKSDVLLLWFWLGNLNNVYQEFCRELWLPKFLGLASSYPTFPFENNDPKYIDKIVKTLRKHFI